MKINKFAIEQIVDALDFQRIAKVMRFLKWKYGANSVTVETLRENALQVGYRVLGPKVIACQSGGFVARTNAKKTRFEICFSISEADSCEE